MFPIEKIPDQVGYLVLTEDGEVIQSGGELENDERKAAIIIGLVSMTANIDPAVFSDSTFKRISIVFDEHSYLICLSNKRIYVVKRILPANRSHEIDSVSP